MADGEVRIKIVADSADIEKTRQALEKFAQSLKGTGTEGAKALDKAGESAREAGKEIEKVGEKADKTGKAVKEAGDKSKSLDKVGESAQEAGKGLDKTEKEATEAGQALDKVGETAESAGKKVKESGEQGAKGLKEVPPQAQKGKEGMEQLEKGADRATGGIKRLLVAVGALKAIGAIMGAVSNAVGDAVSRFDTLGRYPRVMEAMGYSSEQSSRSIRALSKGIEGLPTRLDAVVSTTQQIASMTGDIDRATKTTLALNNAFIASGSSAGDAERGLTQYIQMMSSGKVDMQSWKTLNETMAYGLQTVAKEFGFTGESAKNKLYSALRDGSITFTQFNAKLIEASERAGGFAEMALKSSDGIDTAMKNITSAIVKGVEGSIRALDELVQAVTGKNISQNLTSLKFVINGAFGAINNAIRATIPFFKTVVTVVGALITAIKPLAPVLLGIATAFAVVKAQGLILTLFHSLNSAMSISAVTANGFAIRMAMAQATMATGSSVIGVLAGGFTALKTALLGAWSALGPLAIGIGALVAVGKVLYDTFIKMTPEMEAFTKETQETADASKRLSDEINATQDSFGKSQEATKAQGEALSELAEKVIALSDKTGKSALEHKTMKDAVKDLNTQIDGLGLSYDKTTGQINMNAEALRGLVEVHNKEAERVAVQQRLVEIEKERSQVEAQRGQNMSKLVEAEDKWNSANAFQRIGMGKTKEAIESLNTANEGLADTEQRLALEKEALTQRQIELANEMVVAEQNANNQVITSYSQLNEGMKGIFDDMKKGYDSLKESTQNFTTQIKDHIEGTTADGQKYVKSSAEVFSEMESNLQHNQQVVATWSENINSLSKRGIDNGLLEALRNMGPEGSAYVQALADQSDEKLAQFSNTFANGGEEAKKALLKSLGVKESELPEGFTKLMTTMDTNLRTQLEEAGFKDIGKDINTRLAEGIKEGQTDVSDATKEVVESVPTTVTENPEPLNNAGKEIPKQVAEGIKANTQEIKDATKEAVDKVPEAVTENATQAQEAGKQVITEVGNGASEQANTTGQDIGKDTVSGLVSGINDNASMAGQAGSDLAKEVTDSAQSDLGIHSPSTVFRGFGQNIDQGLADGINGNKGPVTSAITAVISALNDTFTQGMRATNNIANQGIAQTVATLGSRTGEAYNAGYWTGMGFSSGLASSAWSIYAVANAIASNVASTMRRALNIHSPSRVTRAIGRFTGEGLALGLDDMQGRVEASAEGLAHSALPQINMASTLALAGATGFSTSNVYDNRQYNFNAGSAGSASGRLGIEEQKRLFKEFAYYMRTEGART